MECTTISELRLDTLSSGIPALSSGKASHCMEACVWCLLECEHDNGVTMVVTFNEVNKEYKIFWKDNNIDRDALSLAYNKDDGPEHGAVAIALLLVRETTEYTAFNRAVNKTGIDYWLGYKDNAREDQIFSIRGARVEISAILRQSLSNKPSYRVREKIVQTRQSDKTNIFPVYVIVVEFSQPMANMDCRNV